jgi:hypothetical protein
MLGSGVDLALYNLPSFAAKIAGFDAGTTIDLGAFAYSATATSSFVEASSNTSGTLTITNGGSVASLTLDGRYVTTDFALSNDGTGNTFVKFV